MPQNPSKGRMVRYVSHRNDDVVGIITAVHPGNRVNLFLIRDGVNQAHLDPHIYEVDYAPVAPDGTATLDTWHWPPQV